MARQIDNYHRFYASFNRLPKHGDDEEAKAALVSQWTGGRTTHLHEMTVREYTECCKALERMLGYGDQRKRHRSICLHLMQELGIDTRDWQRINDFCRNPRISGKEFALLGIPELEALAVKLRAIKRKGGLRISEERRVKSEESNAQHSQYTNQQSIIITSNGTNEQQQPTSGQLPC